MNPEDIKNAVDKLLHELKESGYSQNTIEFCRSRCNAVMAYSQQEKVLLSIDGYLSWADQFTEGKSGSIRCCMKRVIVMLDCIIRGIPLPQNNVGTVGPLALKNLKFAEAADGFERLLKKRGQGKNTVKFSVYCAKHFFSHMENHGVGSITEITRKQVAGLPIV